MFDVLQVSSPPAAIAREQTRLSALVGLAPT
jgi:hypothetical protein